MRYHSCLRYVLVGFVLIAAATPIALACFKIKQGGGANGTQSGAECAGGCVLYVDCPESDACKRALVGAKTCTLVPGLARCGIFVNGWTLPGTNCCTGGTYRSRGTLVAISIAVAKGDCALGFGIPDIFGPHNNPCDAP